MYKTNTGYLVWYNTKTIFSKMHGKIKYTNKIPVYMIGDKWHI